MKIIKTSEGNVALILNEEEVNTIINLSEHKAPEKKKEIEKKPILKGIHKNNRTFIIALYNAYGEGNIIHLSDEIYMNLRKTYFVVNATYLLGILNNRGIIQREGKTFMFLQNPNSMI